ncbi:MAG TPA: hypothetical protein VD994_05065 [Prosthecobacter sp.]|nr:hypothetical protein [Prosthecobacter sp.]
MSWLLKYPSGGAASSAAPEEAEVYEYPNDDDATMEEAVGAIWGWYVKLDRRIRISVQGMGGRLDSYDCHEARFVDGVLAWDDGEGATEEQRRQPDAIEVGSEEEFRRVFLDWAKRRVTPWEDTGELAFGVMGLGDMEPSAGTS